MTNNAHVDLSKALSDYLEEKGIYMAKSLGATQGFDIQLNEQGRGTYDKSVQGIAFLINKSVSAVITAPDGVFDIRVTTSAGSDERFNGIRTGQKISCKLRIKGKTGIHIEIGSNTPNKILHGELTY